MKALVDLFNKMILAALTILLSTTLAFAYGLLRRKMVKILKPLVGMCLGYCLLFFTTKAVTGSFKWSVLASSFYALAFWIGTRFSVIGLTGGIACGKSTVSKVLAQNGFDIIDADKISHDVMRSDKKLIKSVAKNFPGVVTDGVVDRAKLGSAIFSDANKRRTLNKLTHPAIMKEMLRQIVTLRIFERKQLVVLDVPLLFETKVLEYFCYPILVVYNSGQEQNIQRLVARDKITYAEALKKIEAQMPIGLKVRKADVLIQNSGSEQDLQDLLLNTTIG